MASDRVTYSMENGDLRVELDPIVPKKFLKAAGMAGSGIAPTKVNILQSVRGGGRHQSTIRLSRDMDLPITVFGAGRAEIERNLDELIGVFQDKFTTPMLVATYPNGDQWETEFHYSSGADHTWGTSDTNGKNYVKWPIQIACPSPYWTSRQPTTFEISASQGRGLLRGPLTKLRLSPSQALGTVTLLNTGHVEAYPFWIVRGPASGFTGTRTVDGAQLVFTESLGVDDQLFIDTKNATIQDQNGNNRFEGLVGAPKFFTIPPGLSEVSAVINDASSQSSITMSFRPRREMIF